MGHIAFSKPIISHLMRDSQYIGLVHQDRIRVSKETSTSFQDIYREINFEVDTLAKGATSIAPYILQIEHSMKGQFAPLSWYMF
jgi:hypothetical protein